MMGGGECIMSEIKAHEWGVRPLSGVPWGGGSEQERRV